MSEHRASTLPAAPAVTISLDETSQQVMIAALDLYQRVQMGQWREVAAVCGVVLGDQAGPFTDAADALMKVRARFATDPNLRDARAALSIRSAGEPARVAYDLWHALGGGMESRRDMRTSDAVFSVSAP